MTMSKFPSVAEWLLWSLRVLTHSFETPGGAWFSPDFFARYDHNPFTPIGPGSPARPVPSSGPGAASGRARR